MGKVMIIMGSASDKDKVEPAIRFLTGKTDLEVHIASAHRTPEKLARIVEDSDADVFIAAAGMAAALPGAVAALTVKPVIGVPLSGGPLSGLDALFAIVQMPRGIPVASVAIDGSTNAAILALQILAVKETTAEDLIYKMREEYRHDVAEKDADLTESINTSSNRSNSHQKL